jgi:acetolactate synthase-1/2/3 large subunit
MVTGQIQSDLIGRGRGVLHEINDQMETIASVTKWQGRAMKPAEIPALVHRAVQELRSGRPRPVELEIPPDVLEAKGDVMLLEAEEPQAPAIDTDALESAARMLGQAKSPLIFSGGGIIGGQAWEELQRLAEALEAPAIMTANGRGALSDRHHLAHGPRSTRALLPDSDVILVVGTRFVYGAGETMAKRDKRVIQIDIDPEEVGRNYKPDIGIVADAGPALGTLCERVGQYNSHRPSRREELTALKQSVAEQGLKTQPQASFALAIRAELPDDGVFFQESTQVGYWSSVYFPVYNPRTYFTSGYQGTLGYGFPTAMGAQTGLPGKRVVSVNGDGGFFYNVQELSTLAQQNIPLTAIVFNDNAYGNVKRIQQTRFGGRELAVDLHNPDMLKLAEAYGVEGRRATTPEELRRVLHEVFASPRPVLIEVPVGQMPQMV